MPDLGEAVEDAKRLGLGAEAVAALQGADAAAAKGFEVWPVNMAIVDAFCGVATQWRTLALTDGRVLWLGLDYTAVRARLGVLTPRLWRGLGVMERAGADALNGGLC